MKNKEISKEVSIDTFSVLNTAGWLLMILRLSGCITLSWGAIANYWFVFAGTIVVFVLLNTLISCLTILFKGGDNSAK